MNIAKKIGRLWLAALLVIAALVVVTTATIAVFTYQANKKGVISTNAVDTLFASDYLKLCAYDVPLQESTDGYEQQTLIFTKKEQDSATHSFQFTVQNYLVKTSPNENTIHYKLTLKLLANADDYGTLSAYKIERATGGTQSPFDETTKSWTSSQYTLYGGDANADTFTVTLPQDALDKVQLLVVAQPESDSLAYTNQKKLACVFNPCTEANVKGFEITHSFVDSNMKNTYPYNFDAFNYQVSINTGKASVTLRWDSEKVTIDPFFEKRVDGTMGSDGSSITFEMDSDKAGSCLVQFYRIAAPNKQDSWQTSWDEMEKVIKVTGEQTEEEPEEP